VRHSDAIDVSKWPRLATAFGGMAVAESSAAVVGLTSMVSSDVHGLLGHGEIQSEKYAKGPVMLHGH